MCFIVLFFSRSLSVSPSPHRCCDGDAYLCLLQFVVCPLALFVYASTLFPLLFLFPHPLWNPFVDHGGSKQLIGSLPADKAYEKQRATN
uniref:Uncharacterized protein n=1 Tax=Zea mays TaxID=4577 RepID=A0A804LDK8_MAIZE